MILRRSTVAALAAAALTIAPVAAAEAAPHGGRSHAAHAPSSGSASTRAVLKEIKVKDRALARIAASKPLTRLPDAQEAVLAASVTADRAALAALGDAIGAGTTTARAARTTLRSYRVESYLVAAALLRGAATLRAAAGDVPEVVAAIDDAVATALTVTATNGRTVLRAAHDALEAAWEAYEGEGEDD